MWLVTQSTDPSRLGLAAAIEERGVACRVLRVHDDLGLRWLARRRPPLPPRGPAADPPLPCLARLSKALEPWGVAREASETLEQLASRLGESRLPDARARSAAALLRRYGALRYGKVGDEAALVQDIDRFCRQLLRL